MKESIIITIVVISCILILPFVFSFIHPWTNVQCKKQYIDISTAMSRTQKYYWFLKCSDKIEPTYLSELIGVDSAENPDWRTVNTFSFGHSNSPNYRFHGAFGQIIELKLMISLYNINEDDSKAIAREVIKIWKENQSYFKAEEYLHEINMQYGKDL